MLSDATTAWNLKIARSQIIELWHKEVMCKTFRKTSDKNEWRPVYWWKYKVATARRQCIEARRKLIRYNKRRDTQDEDETTLTVQYKEKTGTKMYGVLDTK